MQNGKMAMNFSVVYGQRAFDFIVWGFFFHLMGQVVSTVTRIDILQAFVCTIGWYFIIKGFIMVRRLGFHTLPGTCYRGLFILYLMVCMVMIVRGYLIDYRYQWKSWLGMINFHLFAPTYILPYLMPLIAFIPCQYYNLRTFIKCSVIVACISIVLLTVSFGDIRYASNMSLMGYDGFNATGSTLAHIYIPVGFAVLCRKYVSNKVWLINSVGLLLTLLVYAVAARRGSTVITACLFLFNIYFYVKSKSRVGKIIAVVLSLIVICCAAYFFITSDLFAYIQHRGMTDNRSAIDDALLSQMSDWELIFGKGLNGRYYLPLLQNDYLGGWRYGSETGFYNIVLKGGYLMAILYIVLLAYPALIGIFKSNNTLCKALGFYIILSLIELYPFGWLSFNLKFLIIWMGVALCLNRNVRNMSDRQIYKYYF